MSSEQNPNGNGKRSPIITILIISLVLGGGIFLLNRVITASAASSDYSLMLGTYPNISGSRIDSCSLCHTANIPGLNPYGAAYKGLGRGNANSMHMIEALDSDGDGYTNIQEINALTFPGNAADFPQTPTNTPTTVPPTSTPTNTSVPPTATNTGVPPTATNTGVPPTATNQGNPPPATATPAPTSQPTVKPSGEPTMKATRTGEREETETEEPAKTSQPRETEHPKETERPEPTKVVMTRTPYPSRTPMATRVYPTRQVTPTMVCVKDDSSQKSDSYTFTGSSGDRHDGIRCQSGYHVLGDYSYDFTNYFIKPFYNFYSRRDR